MVHDVGFLFSIDVGSCHVVLNSHSTYCTNMQELIISATESINACCWYRIPFKDGDRCLREGTCCVTHADDVTHANANAFQLTQLPFMETHACERKRKRRSENAD